MAQVIDRIVRSGGNAVLAIFSARVLGSADYGMLAYLLTVVGFASILSTLGLANFTLISFARLPAEETDTWLSTLVILRQAGALAAVGGAMLFLATIRHASVELVILGGMIASSQLLQSLDCYESFYLARGQAGAVLLVRWFSFAMLGAAKIAACIWHAPLGIFALLAALDLGLYGATYLVLAPKNRPRLHWRQVRWSIMKEALGSCWPLAIASLTVLTYMRYDQFLISRYLGDRALGQYAVAVVVAELWNFVANALSVAFMPRLTAMLGNGGESKYSLFFGQLTRLAFWGSFSYSLAVFLLAEPIIRILYGSEFATAASTLRILCWTAPLIAVGILNAVWVVHHQIQSVWLFQTLIVATFSIISNQFVVHRFGVNGAALVLLASQLLACLLLNGFFKATQELFATQLKAIFNLGQSRPSNNA